MANWEDTNEGMYLLCKEVNTNGTKNIKIKNVGENRYEVDVTSVESLRKFFLRDSPRRQNYVIHVKINIPSKHEHWESGNSYFVVENPENENYYSSTHQLKFDRGDGWGRVFCHMISIISNCDLAKEWNSHRTLSEEDKRRFLAPNMAKVEGYKFYREFKNENFNHNNFEHIKEWWNWVWEMYEPDFNRNLTFLEKGEWT